MGRFIPITVNFTAEKRVAKVPNAKVYYDGKQCWQYKVVYDKPGTYSYSPPAGITCLRTVIVGGGGKPICTSGNCCGYGGAGGGYCAITDIVPLTPIKWNFAILTNGSNNMFVGYENINVGGINHIFGISGILFLITEI